MDKVLRTHKIALDLNDKQRTYLAKCAAPETIIDLGKAFDRFFYIFV
jgi:hypothetical protein